MSIPAPSPAVAPVALQAVSLPAGNAWDVQGTVDQLWIHPVKSCAGLAVPSARLLSTGLEWDRAWMVVDCEGTFVSQRELPGMALIRPALQADGLVLSAPDMPVLRLPLHVGGPMRRVRVWKDDVQAHDMGDVAACWFSDWARHQPSIPTRLRSLRLVRSDPAQPRWSSLRWTRGLQVPNLFGDGFPLLVTSVASIQGLNARLEAAGMPAVDVRRMRPNLVLAGVDEHDEDRLDAVWLDALPAVSNPMLSVSLRVELALTKPCARCPVPDVNPDTGLPDAGVGKVLQTYRHDPRLEGAVTFGMNAFSATTLPPEGVLLHVGQAFGARWCFD